MHPLDVIKYYYNLEKQNSFSVLAGVGHSQTITHTETYWISRENYYLGDVLAPASKLKKFINTRNNRLTEYTRLTWRVELFLR